MMDGEGSGSQTPTTFTQDQVDALIAQEVEGLKANRDEAFQRLQKSRDQLKTWEAIGGDPTEIGEKLAKLAEIEQKGQAEKAGLTDDQLKKLRHDIRGELEKEYAPFKTQAEQLGAQVRELQLDNVVKRIMGEKGVRAERIDPLFQLTKSQFELTDDGKPMLANNPGLEVDKYIADELMKLYPEFYQGSGSSGGGAPKSSGGRMGSVSAGDNASFLQNLDKIAKGEVRVTE